MQAKNWEELGVRLPDILVPKRRDSLTKWCVIACDQYTSDRQYWSDVECEIGDEPSTLNAILPEVYLNDKGVDARIACIGQSMDEMLSGGVLETLPPGLVLVERTFCCHDRTRTGLLMALDLERYDYEKGTKTLIRATEGTIPSRIPPRLRIREKAKMEFPHIMVLIDDPDRSVIEPLKQQKQGLKMIYNSDLGFSLGHVTGHYINAEQAEPVRVALSRLMDGLDQPATGDPMLFAMGDGNHSFATARAHWQNVRQTLTRAERETHPARFAMCEVVNIHDEGLVFEAIHRIVFHAGLWEDFLSVCREAGKDGIRASWNYMEGAQCVKVVHKAQHSTLYLLDDSGAIAAGTVDRLLQQLNKRIPKAEVDYIHGEDELVSLCQDGDNIGVLLPALSKSQLFDQVSEYGPLPRKAFSMGEADEKRCYLEGRIIARL